MWIGLKMCLISSSNHLLVLSHWHTVSYLSSSLKKHSAWPAAVEVQYANVLGGGGAKQSQ